MTYFSDLAAALAGLQLNQSGQLDLLVQHICQTKKAGGTLYICGNGGSFANALHWGVDLSKAGGVKTHVLGSNSATLTAYSNDVSYEEALSRELKALISQTDMLVVLTVSGRSKNVLGAMGTCFRSGCPCFLIAGKSAPSYVEGLPIVIPSDDYGVVEDCHAAICHWLVGQLRGDK